MSKGLEALKRLQGAYCWECRFGEECVNEKCPFNRTCNDIEKELKALDCLIKELKLTVYKSKDVFDEEDYWIMKPTNNNYFNQNEMFKISKDCYDLMKEILENE